MRNEPRRFNKPGSKLCGAVVKSFHAQLEASKGPATRIRYGFLPNSTNSTLEDCSRTNGSWTSGPISRASRPARSITLTCVPITTISFGSLGRRGTTSVSPRDQPPPASTETGSASYSCDTGAPRNAYTTEQQLLSTSTEPYAGPPAGTKTVERYQRTINGKAYWVERSGNQCIVKERSYHNYTDEFDKITVPAQWTETVYTYKPYTHDVSGWRGWGNGCIEERETVEIADYDNVDFGAALDLDLDRVPVAGQVETQWRPAKPSIIYERSMRSNGSGSFVDADVVTSETFLAPGSAGFAACPSPARKLEEMTASEINSYVASLRAEGSTYHDIGMIWGGRLISPTGLFADENADARDTGPPAAT